MSVAVSSPILTLNIRSEHDTVAGRQRARQIARLPGFDAQDQTRIATAVSEIARNAFRYAGGGKVEYLHGRRTASAAVYHSHHGQRAPAFETSTESWKDVTGPQPVWVWASSARAG